MFDVTAASSIKLIQLLLHCTVKVEKILSLEDASSWFQCHMLDWLAIGDMENADDDNAIFCSYTCG